MRTALAFLAVALLLTAGCATNNANGQVPDPEVRLTQTSRVPDAAEFTTGGMPVSLHMDVTNRATVPITFKRVDIASLNGAGGYQVPSTSRPFNVTIAPGATESVEFWVAAYAMGQNITGANEPVTLRAVSVFDSSLGALQTVVVQPVSAR